MKMTQSPSDYPTRVRRRVRVALAEHEISASEMARRCGWTQSYISRRMAGRSPFDVADLARIAEELGIGVSSLTAEPAEAVA